jgi:hypothetical protein
MKYFINKYRGEWPHGKASVPTLAVEGAAMVNIGIDARRRETSPAPVYEV